jgi:hypothetical protein
MQDTILFIFQPSYKCESSPKLEHGFGAISDDIAGAAADDERF